MTTLKETAKAFEPQQTRNVTELEKVPVDAETQIRIYKENTPEQFTKTVIVVGGLDYYVPNSVIEEIKMLLEKMPTLQFVQVEKKGEGLNTKYKVFPVM